MARNSVVLVLLGLSLLSLPATAARLCDKARKGDFRDCVQYLKSTFQGDEGKKQFVKDFDEICQTSNKFKCTKVTVMGDLKNTEESYRKNEDWKGAEIFAVEMEDGKYLMIFQRK